MTDRSKQRILSRIEKYASPGPTEKRRGHPDRRHPTTEVEISKKLQVLEENLDLTSTDYILIEERGELENTLIRCFEKYRVRKAVIFDTEVPGGTEMKRKWQDDGQSSPQRQIFFGSEKIVECGDSVGRFLDEVDMCVTGCRSIVAEGGVSIIDSSSDAGRLASLLPAHHVIVAERSAIASRLEDVVDLISSEFTGGILPKSSFVFISGPSRTADIEKQLVLGVHGPLSLTVIIVP